MDSVLRAAVIYFSLLILIRIAGNRALSQITVFDFVLLLIISEAAQNAMIGNDYSITNGLLVITTLILIDIALSLAKRYSPRLERFLDGLPLIIVDRGKPVTEHMDKSRVDDSDIMESARELHGLERLEQIKYAVLERGGEITIIPKEQK